MVKDDVVLAQKIISRSEFNFGCENTFHNSSAIYRFSNERLQDYGEYFVNRNKILSVISSGDQILNAILNGVKDIDAFDISVFPKYFLYLKIGAIKSLSREEYLNFFCDTNYSAEDYDDMYERIRENLDEEIKEFWDGLFDFFDWQDIYNSTLFSSEPYFTSTAIEQNRYLKNDESYNRLRDSINDVNINIYEGNIFDLVNSLNNRYDLIYLSNIFYYNDANDYRELLGKLLLTDNGITITYLYRVNEKIKKFFSSDGYEFEKFVNVDSGIMIYHK